MPRPKAEPEMLRSQTNFITIHLSSFKTKWANGYVLGYKLLLGFSRKDDPFELQLGDR